MKKIIALFLATLMLVSFAACGKKDDTSSDIISQPSSQAGSSDQSSQTTDTTTVGKTLLKEFKDNNSGSALSVAERLITHSSIKFMGDANPIEEGLLSGFDNTEIKGFKEGAMFGPMMSSIAFIGYIFELEDGADIDAFKQNLKDSANLR